MQVIQTCRRERLLGLIIKNPTDFTLGILLALVFALDIATTQRFAFQPELGLKETL